MDLFTIYRKSDPRNDLPAETECSRTYDHRSDRFDTRGTGLYGVCVNELSAVFGQRDSGVRVLYHSTIEYQHKFLGIRRVPFNSRGDPADGGQPGLHNT